MPVIVFLTLAIKPRGDFLANDVFHAVFCEVVTDADAWSVGRYLIMPDHVHLFCQPACTPFVSLKRWVPYLKECITKRLRRGNSMDLPWRWQQGFWDTQIRNGTHYHERWLYVLDNPVRAGLICAGEQWQWQGEVNELRW